MKVDSTMKDVVYALFWDLGHPGNYDVLGAFSWIDKRLAAGN